MDKEKNGNGGAAGELSVTIVLKGPAADAFEKYRTRGPVRASKAAAGERLILDALLSSGELNRRDHATLTN
jgi:hypothetical protein